MTQEQNRGWDSVEIVRELRAPRERVFKALTDSADLVAWWGAKTAWWMSWADSHPRPGGRYRFELTNRKSEIAFIEGDYQVVERPRRIVKTWHASMYPGVASVVEFLLESIPSGTRLIVRHSGLVSSPAALAEYEDGWVEILLKLATWLFAAVPSSASSLEQGARPGPPTSAIARPRF